MTTGIRPRNTFIKGFNTESSPLVFPEDFCEDELNMNISSDGARRRRLGLDRERGGTLSADTAKNLIDRGSISTFVWNSPNNDGTIDIACVQVGRTLHFYKMEEGHMSSNKYASTVDISQFKATYANDVISERVQMASGLGYLVVVSDLIEPFYVTFDQDAETFSATQITINIRDIIGLDDGTEIDERIAAGSRTAAKDYNLLNQGWTETNIDAVISGLSGLPSNADIMHLGKNSSGAFASGELNNQFFGNSKAPRGKYIVNAFYIDRSTIADPDTTEDVSGIAIEETDSRPTTVDFMSGRVFYAGVKHPNKPTRIYFSEVLTDITKIGNCHAEADPTSEHTSDLVDTDGGYITLPEAGEVYRLKAFSSTMVVFADNGVWQIRGGENGFTATSFFTSRITDVGTVSGFSVVEAEGTLAYWNQGGIYQATVDTVTAELVIQNISEASIQTFYNNIPTNSQRNVWGVYDNVGKKVYWYYNNQYSIDPVANRNKFTNILFIDLRSSGFYKYEVSASSSVFMSVPFMDTLTHIESKFETLIDSTDAIVTDSTGAAIIVEKSYDNAAQYKLKMVLVEEKSSTEYQITFGEFRNATFYDWEEKLDTSKVDFSSYLLGGPDTMKNWISHSNQHFIYFASQKSETGFITDLTTSTLELENPAAINYRYRFNWNDNDNSNQWTPLQTDGYYFERPYLNSGSGDTFDTGETVLITKVNLEGRGRAFQLYLEASEGKEMHIYGWATLETDTKSLN